MEKPLTAEGIKPEAGLRATSPWSLAIPFLLLSLLLYLTSYTAADPDLWGHLRFGQDICQTGAIIQDDRYSYLTQGQPWMNHEWLAEVAFAASFHVAGAPGLILLKVAVALLILGLIYRQLCVGGLNVLRGGIVLLAIAFLFLVWINTVRPQLFTYLLFLMIVLIIHAAEHGRPRWLWAAPVVFALWVNLHGGFLAGLAFLLAWYALHLTQSAIGHRLSAFAESRMPMAEVTLAVIASVLATLVNPHGIDLPLFLLRTATVPRPEIIEWGPIRISSLEGGVYLLLLALTAFGLSSSRRPRSPALLGLLLGMGLAPLQAIRHLPLFATAVAVLAGEHIADAWEQWFPGDARAESSLRSRPWLVLFSGLAAIGLVAAAVPHFGCLRLTGMDFPVRAVGILKESNAKGNLVVHFDWGEYVIWHLGPRIQVSLDGRRETVYSNEVYRENLNYMFGLGDWDIILHRPGTDLALVSKKFPVFNLMKFERRWVLVYEDKVCGLFAREDSPWLGRLRQTQPPDLPADGAGLCFP